MGPPSALVVQLQAGGGSAFGILEVGEVAVNVVGGHRLSPGFYWTTMRVLPSGSRSQNIGGTGSPIRLTSTSTSTPARRSCS